MTIREAVGLVLQAGYGDYGELCVLDMGEQIKIVDLARHMITMAGHVPDVDIAIEFTGLRPGEKLYEELLTEEEERTHQVDREDLRRQMPGAAGGSRRAACTSWPMRLRQRTGIGCGRCCVRW